MPWVHIFPIKSRLLGSLSNYKDWRICCGCTCSYQIEIIDHYWAVWTVDCPYKCWKRSGVDARSDPNGWVCWHLTVIASRRLHNLSNLFYWKNQNFDRFPTGRNKPHYLNPNIHRAIYEWKSDNIHGKSGCWYSICTHRSSLLAIRQLTYGAIPSNASRSWKAGWS